jgi:hypothetical protein
MKEKKSFAKTSFWDTKPNLEKRFMIESNKSFLNFYGFKSYFFPIDLINNYEIVGLN